MYQIARCEPECGWSFGPSQDVGAINRACSKHELDCMVGGPVVEWCPGPTEPPVNYCLVCGFETEDEATAYAHDCMKPTESQDSDQ